MAPARKRSRLFSTTGADLPPSASSDSLAVARDASFVETTSLSAARALAAFYSSQGQEGGGWAVQELVGEGGRKVYRIRPRSLPPPPQEPEPEPEPEMDFETPKASSRTGLSSSPPPSPSRTRTAARGQGQERVPGAFGLALSDRAGGVKGSKKPSITIQSATPERERIRRQLALARTGGLGGSDDQHQPPPEQEQQRTSPLLTPLEWPRRSLRSARSTPALRSPSPSPSATSSSSSPKFTTAPWRTLRKAGSTPAFGMGFVEAGRGLRRRSLEGRRSLDDLGRRVSEDRLRERSQEEKEERYKLLLMASSPRDPAAFAQRAQEEEEEDEAGMVELRSTAAGSSSSKRGRKWSLSSSAAAAGVGGAGAGRRPSLPLPVPFAAAGRTGSTAGGSTTTTGSDVLGRLLGWGSGSGRGSTSSTGPAKREHQQQQRQQVDELGMEQDDDDGQEDLPEDLLQALSTSSSSSAPGRNHSPTLLISPLSLHQLRPQTSLRRLPLVEQAPVYATAVAAGAGAGPGGQGQGQGVREMRSEESMRTARGGGGGAGAAGDVAEEAEEDDLPATAAAAAAEEEEEVTEQEAARRLYDYLATFSLHGRQQQRDATQVPLPDSPLVGRRSRVDSFSSSSFATSSASVPRVPQAGQRLSAGWGAGEDPRFAIWGSEDGTAAVIAAQGSSSASLASSWEDQQGHQQGQESSPSITASSSAGRFSGGRYSLYGAGQGQQPPESPATSTSASFSSSSSSSHPPTNVSSSSNNNPKPTHQKKVLLAATIPRLIAELTSRIEPMLVREVMVTFRLWWGVEGLLEGLLGRFDWALFPPPSSWEVSREGQGEGEGEEQEEDETEKEAGRRIVKVRTFVLLRTWLNEHFEVDFLPAESVQVRRRLCGWLNETGSKLAVEAQAQGGEGREADRRLVRGLKKAVRRLKARYAPLGGGGGGGPGGGSLQEGYKEDSEDEVDLEFESIHLTRSSDPAAVVLFKLNATPPLNFDDDLTAGEGSIINPTPPLQAHELLSSTTSPSRRSRRARTASLAVVERGRTEIAKSFSSALGSLKKGLKLGGTAGGAGRASTSFGAGSPVFLQERPTTQQHHDHQQQQEGQHQQQQQQQHDLLFVEGGVESFLKYHGIQLPATPAASGAAGVGVEQQTTTQLPMLEDQRTAVEEDTDEEQEEEQEEEEDRTERFDGLGLGLAAAGIGGGVLDVPVAGGAGAGKGLSHSASTQTIKGGGLGTASQQQQQEHSLNSFFQPHRHPRPTSRVELDSLSDSSSGNDSSDDEDVIAVQRTLRRLPGGLDLRNAKAVRELQPPSAQFALGVRGSGETFASYEPLSLGDEEHHHHLMEEGEDVYGAPNSRAVVEFFVLSGLESDSDSSGSGSGGEDDDGVAAALKRLEGVVDRRREQKRREKVEKMMGKSEALRLAQAQAQARSRKGSRTPSSLASSSLSSAAAAARPSAKEEVEDYDESSEPRTSFTGGETTEEEDLDLAGTSPISTLATSAGSSALFVPTSTTGLIPEEPEEEGNDYGEEGERPANPMMGRDTPLPLTTSVTPASNANTTAVAAKPSRNPNPPPVVKRKSSLSLGRKSSLSRIFSVSSSSLPRSPQVQGAAAAAPAHRSFILAFRTEVLAEQFALIERDLLRAVGWEELLAGPGGGWEDHHGGGAEETRDWEVYLKERRVAQQLSTEGRKNKGKGALRDVIRRFNLTANWVASEIVLTSNLPERVVLVSKLIRLAFKCYRQSNLQTLLQLVHGLQNPAVERLQRTWAKVPPWERRQFELLKRFVSHLRNFKFLREETNLLLLQRASPEQLAAAGLEESLSATAAREEDSRDPRMLALTNGGCIPFLGLFLRDLAIFAELPSYLDPSFPSEPASLSPSGALLPLAPDQLASLPPLPHYIPLAPLVNLQKFRLIAGTVEKLRVFQSLAERYSWIPEREAYLRCLKIRCLDQQGIEDCSVRLE